LTSNFNGKYTTNLPLRGAKKATPTPKGEYFFYASVTPQRGFLYGKQKKAIERFRSGICSIEQAKIVVPQHKSALNCRPHYPQKRGLDNQLMLYLHYEI